jgi:hypothetical protein
MDNLVTVQILDPTNDDPGRLFSDPRRIFPGLAGPELPSGLHASGEYICRNHFDVHSPLSLLNYFQVGHFASPSRVIRGPNNATSQIYDGVRAQYYSPEGKSAMAVEKEDKIELRVNYFPNNRKE